MIFRFTLNNDIEGSQEINEPDGWKDVKISLERDPVFHSLVEVIDTAFFFYNANDFVDGGRQYLINIEQTQGIAAVVTLLVEISEDDGTTWDEVFTGNLDLSTIKDISSGEKFYKFQCAILPSSIWSTFMNRKSLQIDLNSTASLDGVTVATPTTRNVLLTPQAVRKNGRYEQYPSSDSNYVQWGYNLSATKKYAGVDLPNIVLNEVGTKYNYPDGDGVAADPAAAATIDLELVNVDEAGTYAFDIQIVLADQEFAVGSTYPSAGTIQIILEINKNVGTVLTESIVGTIAVNQRGVHTYTGSMSLNKGDLIKLYIKYNAVGAATYYVIADSIYENSYISITADTTVGNTTIEALTVFDAANSLVKRMTNNDFSVVSDYLTTGCGRYNVISKGKNVRGYSFTEKPFSMSFDDWWNGMNPIFCLGLGQDGDTIRIEDMGYFYDNDTSYNFDNVQGIERSYDPSILPKSFKIGYQTWSAESGSGIDDPQTVHEYSTVFKLFGQAVQQLSTFVTAGMAIEQTRRKGKTENEDWKLDENVILIATDASYVPEQDTPFTSITNIFNGSTRYNIRHTPYRMFQRWLQNWSAAFQVYLSDIFRFNQGEGNVTMSVGANSDTCDTETWTENQNVLPSNDPFHTAEMYNTTEMDLKWSDYKTIRDNRTKPVGISATSSDHKKVHIEKLEYDIVKAKVTVKGHTK